jgi:hypothetical protein
MCQEKKIWKKPVLFCLCLCSVSAYRVRDKDKTSNGEENGQIKFHCKDLGVTSIKIILCRL